MQVGLLPAFGGGIRALAETGQTSRLIDGYLRPYLLTFDGLFYFSYLQESLAEFTDDPALLSRVRVLAPSRPTSRGRRALGMTGLHAGELRSCAALRIFQITGVVPALIAQARFGIPYVTTYGFWYAELAQPGPKRLLKAFVERLGLRRAAAVIATTEELRARAARRARRVELIPNGVDTARFCPTGVPRTAGPRRILYVGRLSPEKNLGAVVAATRHLGDDAVTVMVGSGALKDELAVQAVTLGVRLELPGVVDQRRLPAVYASADAFVLASFTEGHPKALLEAMACGVPCVVSDCTGNRSLVTDGETGLLFDPTKPRALAACLERVLHEPGLAERLTRAARERIVARYDLRPLVDREIGLIREIARGGS
jgi:glycosyltransferase involved in cell wall biosynthesis